MNEDKLVIFDTTLRDGEQSAGASMSIQEKVQIALQLERLGVDVIEAGFPISSQGDFSAVSEIASQVQNSVICALARAEQKDIERAAQALTHSKSARIHTFIATSQIHMQYKLKMQPDEVIARAVEAVKCASSYVKDVEFSPEDAGRSDRVFLCEVITAAIEAGATTINIPDTVGYNIPNHFADLIGYLLANVKNSQQAIFSVHCHDDLGLAVANSLLAVLAGARQVECTINGIGERAGNTSLEEVVMAVATRPDVFSCQTKINTQQLVPTSKLVSSVSGMVVQPNKAIVGVNAFAHESGIHQDGVLKHQATYEIMHAADVGWSSNQLRLGKLSGRNALKNRLTQLGVSLEDSALKEVFTRFKELADKKRDVFDDDLLALVGMAEQAGGYQLESFTSSSEMNKQPFVSLKLSKGGEIFSAEACGDGQVNATFLAIEKIVNSGASLLLFAVRNVTDGSDALGEVTVRLSLEGFVAQGSGADTDVIVAAAKAYLNALGRLVSNQSKIHPQFQLTI